MYVNQGIRYKRDLSTNRNRTSLLAWCQASGQDLLQIKIQHATAKAPSTARRRQSTAVFQLMLAEACGAHLTLHQ